ncbi:MAG: hypothetical protein U0414_44150 [Polyangiaceae bacterium]
MRSDFPPAPVVAVQLSAPLRDVAVARVGQPVHEYVALGNELRRFRREIRRRAHVHAGIRLFSALLIAGIFVLTFFKDSSDNQAHQGFAPRPVAAR